MYSTLCKTTGCALVLVLALAPGAIAQQPQQHRPGHTLSLQGQPAITDEQEDDEEDEAPMMQQMQRMMQQMQDMMQHMRHMLGGGMPGGGMIQRHLERLAQQLGLTDDQRAQAKTLLHHHAREIIRLRADIATMRIDVRELLDTEPVDLPKVKPLLQTIAAKEAELRLSHLTAMQEVRKLLTPEQQKKFRTLQDSMLGDGRMVGPGGMLGGGRMRPGGIMGRGGMMGRGPREQ